MFLEFADLIKENTKQFTMEYPLPSVRGGADDYDDNGKPVNQGAGGVYMPPIPGEGALMPINAKVVYGSGGTYTEADKTLYSLNHDIPEKTRIRYENLVYIVGQQRKWQGYSDFSKYICKAVTAFD